MKRLLLVAVAATVGLTGTAQAANGVPGVDVSNWTEDVDWAAVASGGGKFAFVLATEGVDFRSTHFTSQFDGAAAAGLMRGAYHFAQPHESSGAAQADYFVQNGGAWTGDGKTLPGVLDIEDNPYQAKNGKNNCYGLTAKEMVTWIKDFTKKYRQKTGRNAVIYTTTSWWRTCTGDSDAFKTHPLWIARWGTDPGELPKGWQNHTFWQSAEKGTLAGGQNAFNGTEADLRSLANPPAEVTVSGKARNRKSFTLTVANTGPHPVTDVKVSGRAFGGMRVVKATSGCKFSGTAIRCEIPEIRRGQKKTFTFATKPSKSKGVVGIKFTVGSVELELRAK